MTTGCTQESVQGGGVEHADRRLLRKPFSTRELAQTVRDMLHR